MATLGLYILGVSFAIISGILNNLGSVLQKKTVNEVNKNPQLKEKFFKSLIKHPVWLFGLILQNVLGAAFFMIAQLWVGPALIPGLMAAGLIVLAIGSVKIVGESLKGFEKFGIALMIVAITILGFSNLAIDLTNFNVVETGFLIRTAIFTAVIIALSFVCYYSVRILKRYAGILLAIVSGFQFVLSNFWIAHLMGVIANVFSGDFSIIELIVFIIASIILTGTNIIGLGILQKAYLYGQASNLIPIQQVPIQIAPILIYFIVFLYSAPSSLSIALGWIGVFLIIVSSFLLGRRQATLDNIKEQPKNVGDKSVT